MYKIYNYAYILRLKHISFYLHITDRECLACLILLYIYLKTTLILMLNTMKTI